MQGESTGHSVVGHHYWARPGGGQLVVAAAANSLSQRRRVTLAGTSRFERAKYVDWFGIDIRGLPEVTLPVSLSMFGLYTRLLVWYPIEKALDAKTDLVFLDESNYRPLLQSKRRNGFQLVEYVHFPIELSVGLVGAKDPYVTERYGRFPLNVYWKSYLKMMKLVLRGNPFDSADLVLTNSRWTGRFLKDTYGEWPTVLNPPIPPNALPTGTPPAFEQRDDSVVMIGRFSEEKRYQWAIENIGPRMKGRSKLYLFGGAGTPLSKRYKSRLMSRAAGLGMKASEDIKAPADVFLISDAPRTMINSTLDSAKVFLHATINEHWGIVVAEAMARGVPVVVHKSGGAWSDLAQEGRSGLGYTTSTEAIDSIALLTSDSKRWSTLQREGGARVRELSLSNFARNLNQLVA
ncbi:MAG: glycosyltransferase family 4 protein [Nitrososphaerota archaeon]|nr:glycosyltransferase family 4 protein [Nitrososphaerota archaeon]